jgi:type I restriction enzyme S subunit
MHYLLPQKNTNIAFVYNILQTKNLSSLVTGSSIPHIYFKDYAEYEVFVPSSEEQKQIANYFSNLDKQISIQEQRLEKLKQIKSACLKNMFV